MNYQCLGCGGRARTWILLHWANTKNRALTSCISLREHEWPDSTHERQYDCCSGIRGTCLPTGEVWHRWLNQWPFPVGSKALMPEASMKIWNWCAGVQLSSKHKAMLLLFQSLAKFSNHEMSLAVSSVIGSLSSSSGQHWSLTSKEDTTSV